MWSGTLPFRQVKGRSAIAAKHREDLFDHLAETLVLICSGVGAAYMLGCLPNLLRPSGALAGLLIFFSGMTLGTLVLLSVAVSMAPVTVLSADLVVFAPLQQTRFAKAAHAACFRGLLPGFSSCWPRGLSSLLQVMRSAVTASSLSGLFCCPRYLQCLLWSSPATKEHSLKSNNAHSLLWLLKRMLCRCTCL